MLLSDEDIVRLYSGEELSCEEIAKRDGSYSKRIQRVLKRAGVVLRTKAEAQALAIKKGRSEHPTAGKELSEAQRLKIGASITRHNDSLSITQKKAKSKKSKENWDKRTPESLALMREKAGKSYAETSRNGSKIENEIAQHLAKNYYVEQHIKGLIPNVNLEVDIYLPAYATIIEVDGPTHFLPIWGEASLQKHQKADTEKAGLLINAGFTLIRIKCYPKKVSATKLHAILRELDEVLDSVIRGKSAKHIELEIK